MKIIFKILEYYPDTEQIDVKVSKLHSHKSIDKSCRIALNLDSLDLTDFDTFKYSVGKKLYGHLDRIEEKQPILDINKPDYDEYELDFKNLIGKKIYTHCRDRSTELLKMKRVKL